MKQRDVVWIQIPYGDLVRRKRRPALILACPDHLLGPDMVVCAITSNLEASSFKVPLDTPQMADGAMPRPSMVRADKILAVEKRLARGRVGTVTEATYHDVLETITRVIAPV